MNVGRFKNASFLKPIVSGKLMELELFPFVTSCHYDGEKGEQSSLSLHRETTDARAKK